MKRSDQSLAIYGVLALSGLALIAYTVLTALGKDTADALLAVVVAGGISGTLGWARGGTYYENTPEKIPAPPTQPTPAQPTPADGYDGPTPTQMKDMVS